MEQFCAIADAFPGAFFILNHRDPVASIQSGITMMGYAARFTQRTLDLGQIADYWVDRYEHLLRRCVEDRDRLDPERSYDLYFHKLMADPMGEMESIYDRAGLSFDEATRGAIQGTIEANSRGRHGQLQYDLRGDFGLDPARLGERFGFYFDRFPEIPIEVE